MTGRLAWTSRLADDVTPPAVIVSDARHHLDRRNRQIDISSYTKSSPWPNGQTHWVCDGCGANADWTGSRDRCGACASTSRSRWHFIPHTKVDE